MNRSSRDTTPTEAQPGTASPLPPDDGGSTTSTPPATMDSVPDDAEDLNVPLSMSASVVLEALPRDAQTALDVAARAWDHPSEGRKVLVRFKAVGSAPILSKQVYKISASQRFEMVVNFLRGRLKCGPAQSVFCYVNSVFAPALDEGVGALWRCFKTDDQLIIAYSMTPAFG